MGARARGARSMRTELPPALGLLRGRREAKVQVAPRKEDRAAAHDVRHRHPRLARDPADRLDEAVRVVHLSAARIEQPLARVVEEPRERGAALAVGDAAVGRVHVVGGGLGAAQQMEELLGGAEQPRLEQARRRRRLRSARGRADLLGEEILERGGRAPLVERDLHGALG